MTIDLQDPCDPPASLTDPGQTDPSNYEFTGSTPALTFTPNAFTVSPPDCIITYSCISNTGSRTDLCTVNQNAGLTVSTMNASDGTFTF